MKKVIIVGNGNLANSILENLAKDHENIDLLKYDKNIIADHNSIFIHVGSGREYRDSLDLAIRFNSSYIQAATENDIKMTRPLNKNVRFIHAPNLDINIIRLFCWLKKGKDLFENEPKSILESHQASKKSKPGTAYKFCDILQIQKENFKSIRDREYQQKLNINNLDQHAYHRIEIGGMNSNIVIETKIEGLLSYVNGLYKIIGALDKLDFGCYEIEELVDAGFL